MGYGPALAETEALLAETAPPSSLSCGVSRERLDAGQVDEITEAQLERLVALAEQFRDR